MPTAQTKTSSNSSPTALVAGGAGFLGSHLVATLISQNFNVIVVDNLSSGKKENLKDLLTAPNLTFIEADISNGKLVLPPGISLNYIFHVAGVEEAQNQKNFSLDTLLVNSFGTKQLLELAREHNAKFILGSSADLYSGAISSSSLRYYFGKTPEDETTLTSHEAKRFSEALAFEYFNKFKVAVTVVRLKDSYGPRMDLERGDTVAKMFKQALKGEAVEVLGDGLKILHPTFVSDIVFSLIKAAVGNFDGEIFILVHPEKITVETFAQTLKLVAGPLEIEHKKEKDQVDFSLDHFDLGNTKEKLGWNPKVALAEGIAATIQAFKMGVSKAEATAVVVEAEGETSALKIVETPRSLVSPQSKPSKKPSRWGKAVRIGVFLVSALLIVITLIYPTVSVEVNSYQGTSQIKEGSSSFKANQLGTVRTVSLSSQDSFQTAANSLNNISWLIKLLGQTKKEQALDQVLQSSEALATALRLTAAGEQSLYSSADKADLTAEQAKKELNGILDNIAASEDQLTIVKINLNAIVWQDVPPVTTPDKQFLETETAALHKENQELTTAISNALKSSETAP